MYDNVKLWYEAMNHDRNLFIPLASVNPALGVKYVTEKLNELNSLDVRGLVVSPTLQLFNPLKTEAFKLILEYVEDRDILLIMHLDPCPYSVGTCFKELMPNVLSEVLERYSINIVLSALGISEDMVYPWLMSVSRLIRRYDRVYIETSGISCVLFNTPMGRRIIRSIGTERILFGSGYPYVRFKRVIKDMDCVEKSGLPRYDIEAVLYDNATYLLRMKDSREI
jgi:predicted TIM-barrel fold metal-dependent hydrolase